MKYIGYIKKFDRYTKIAKNLSEMFTEQKLDENLRVSIIDYLCNGNFLFGWMSFLRDDDGTEIGNNDYLTDGYYVWPQYYIYYLNKYENLEIDNEFIDHVKQNKFVVPQLSREELNGIEKMHYQYNR